MKQSAFSRRVYRRCRRLFGFARRVRVPEYELTAPLWSLYRPYLPTFLLVLLVESWVWAFMTYAPVFVARHFATLLSRGVYVFTGLFALAWILHVVMYYFYIQALAGIRAGVNTAGYAYFLRADPLHHTRRSSGAIISRINKGVNKAEALPDIILFDLLPLIVKIVVIGLAFLEVNSELGLLSFGFLSVLVVVACVAQWSAVNVFVPADIEAESDLADVSVESLQNVFLLRARFLSVARIEQLQRVALEYARTYCTSTFGFMTIQFVPRGLYILSCAWLLLRLTALVRTSTLTPEVAIGLAAAYLSAYKFVLSAGKKLQKLLKALAKLQDLRSYARRFGAATIPLETTAPPPPNYPATTLRIENLHFAYAPAQSVFENHRLILTETHGLFGLVGPSGSGKSTLLNILGGQLRPLAGKVLVRGLDLYAVDEATRRSLVALSLQQAGGLHGTVRSNVLLGLDAASRYPTDAEIRCLLECLGLWSMCAQRAGLDTPFGEGGLNLSGGERQRFNLVSLYLRAKAYYPPLILADEPTSALDTVAEEQAMLLLEELATTSVVLVIAHRTSTLARARGVLDFTGIKTGTELRFRSAYSPGVVDNSSLIP